MNKKAQQIAIAKACGWTVIPWEELENPRVAREKKQFCLDTEDTLCCWLPDYVGSLDAMNEAESILTFESGQWKRYEYNLRMILVVSGRSVCNTAQEHRFLRASAAARAEAFLRTLNLWID